jgi:hypothetical protein
VRMTSYTPEFVKSPQPAPIQALTTVPIDRTWSRLFMALDGNSGVLTDSVKKSQDTDRMGLRIDTTSDSQTSLGFCQIAFAPAFMRVSEASKIQILSMSCRVR